MGQTGRTVPRVLGAQVRMSTSADARGISARGARQQPIIRRLIHTAAQSGDTSGMAGAWDPSHLTSMTARFSIKRVRGDAACYPDDGMSLACPCGYVAFIGR
jgi:hypothetical protein